MDDDEDDSTYKIKLFFQNHGSEVIATGLTLEEAQDRCNDQEGSSRTCTSAEGQARTAEFGPWFEGYEQE